jgi:hypothetical protein
VSVSPRTAREVVELYNLVVWNKRDFALAEELIGDTVTRHEVGGALLLTHEEAVNRIIDHQAPMTLNDGTSVDVGSMEIFRVVAWKIAEVWNCGYKQGVWT